MCLIVAKPKGIAVPKADDFKKWFTNHPDGAGVMFNDKGRTHIMKGAMQITDLLLLNETIDTMVDITNTDVVWHFRQATKGGKKQGNTHPYPIANTHLDLTALDITTDIGIAHNGIIYEYSGKVDEKKLTEYNDVTDTQLFISEHLYGMRKFLHNAQFKKLVAVLTGSKFAMLDYMGIDTIGEFIEDGGLLFSNIGYKSAITYAQPYYYYQVDKYNYSPYGDDDFGKCDICTEKCDDLYYYEDMYLCEKCYEIYGEDEVDKEEAQYRAGVESLRKLKDNKGLRYW